jgi:hypothetical protein
MGHSNVDILVSHAQTLIPHYHITFFFVNYNRFHAFCKFNSKMFRHYLKNKSYTFMNKYFFISH